MPTQFRKYGTKVVPKLLEKVNIVDIVDNVSTGGTGVPLSAEQGKVLNGKINLETANRQQAIIDLKGTVTIANDTLGKLENNLNQEIANRQTAVTAEATARTTADNAIRSDFEAADTAMLQTIRDNNSALTDALNSEVARAQSAEQVLSDDLAQEVTDRQTAVSNEATARTTAIANERTRAEAAEAANATAITTEVSRAQAAEATLQTAINAEASRAQGVETTLSNAINTERTQRIDNDTSLDSRLNAIENGLVAGLVWRAALADMAALDALDESVVMPGWSYYVGAEKDVYVVVGTTEGDYRPASWTATADGKSFLKFADFAEVTGLIQAERTRALTAEAELAGNIQSETVRAQTAEGTLTTNLNNEVTARQNADTTLQTNIDAEATARTTAIANERTRAEAEEDRIEGLVSQEVTDRQTAVSNERTRAEAAEAANATAISNEVQARIDAVNTEKTRAQTAEGTLTTNLNNEISNRTAADTAEANARIAADNVLTGRLDVVQGGIEQDGSIQNALAAAKQYTLDYLPRPRVEGIGGNLVVQGDTVTVANIIFDGLNGVIFGEVIVYAGDNNQEAVAVHVSSVSGSVITLAVNEAGEFNGKSAKVSYLYREIDNTSTGTGGAGGGGAGK